MADRRRLGEVLIEPGGQSGVRKASWVLLVRVHNGNLLARHPMSHPLHVQWETVGALRRRKRSPRTGRFLQFRAFLIPAASWSADDRGGKCPALLRPFQPLLWRWRQFGAVCLLLHWWDDRQGLGRRARSCCCCFAVSLPKLLLLLHHLPDLLHLLLPLSNHLLLCHLLPLLNSFTPRTSGENSEDSWVKVKSTLCRTQNHKTSHSPNYFHIIIYIA